MELACVASPVESYEDINNLSCINQDQDNNPNTNSGHGEALCEDGIWAHQANTDVQAPGSRHIMTDISEAPGPCGDTLTQSQVQGSVNLHVSFDRIKDYQLFHFVISKHEIRPLLINVHQTVNDILLKICATFGIDRAEEYSLWLPKGVPLAHEGNIQKFNIGSLSNIFKALKAAEAEEPNCQVLDGNKCLTEQFSFNMKPYIVHLSKYSPMEEVDSSEESTDLGEEWPAFEDEEVARQREFNQCWCGVVQGDYPVEMEVATKLAALLIRVYLSNKQPPEVYNLSIIQQFLPEMFADRSEVAMQVKKFYEALEGTTQSEAIDLVIQTCRRTLTYGGHFFPIQELEVPGQFLSWKKSKQYIFGINLQGVIKIDSFSGRVLSVKRFSDVYSGRCRENVLHLSFRHWDKDFYAKTEQATKILEVLRIYIDLTKRGGNHQVPTIKR